MNRIEREKMVRAMEFIARQVNDEEVFEYWLMDGVADGDIEYGDLNCSDNFDEFYIEDEHFRNLMTDFLQLMVGAWKSGGLYCDRVVSLEKSDFRRKS
ncbi:MAG: hypothetical protein J6S67_15830 [Methanobrevibacter sp.]|nr:hypothetical protein [Methanobrevibacter sp.]